MALDRLRFEAKVDCSGEHHLWRGAVATNGIGQVRVDGKLVTAPRVAYELEHGPLASGLRVLTCPAEPGCVRVDHLRVERHGANKPAERRKRAARGAGSIEAVSLGVWKISVSAGVDSDGQRRRTSRTVRGTRSDAAKALAALVTEVGDGSRLPRQVDKLLTIDALVEWYLTFAAEDRGLEHSTLVGYEDAYKHWLSEVIGTKRASSLTMADLDKAFGRMRRASLSHSRMNNARSVLSGAYKWGKRHGKVTSNPVDGFEIPTSKHTPRTTTAPEIEELLRLLDAADEHDEILAPVLKLGATTGLRRGELSGLRRDRLHLDRHELVVDIAINDAGGVVVEKQTKTRSRRSVTLDAMTVELLAAHLEAMDPGSARTDCCGARRLRLQPRPRLFDTDATRVPDPPNASAPQGTQPD